MMMMNNEILESAMVADDNLGAVTGGETVVRDCHFYGAVGRYDGVIGQNYYVVFEGSQHWGYGTLVGCSASNHTVKFNFQIWEGQEASGIKRLPADSLQLFTNMTRP